MTKMNHPFSLIVGFSLMTAVTIGATASSSAPPTTVGADELFAAFVDLRSSIVLDHEIAQYEDPRFYTRAWLEDAIKSALNAAKQPDRPGLNWAQDSLETKLSSSMAVQSVYSYQLVEPSPNRADLQMYVTDACKRPATYTIEFALEDGAWRIARTNHDSSKSGQAWFKSDLNPIKEFPSITLRDRTRYFNEGALGTALGLNVTPHGCSAPIVMH